MPQSRTAVGSPGGAFDPALRDFPSFYAAHERAIRSILFSLCGPEELDDLAQTVLIKCWTKREQFDGRSSTRTWVTRIALNTAADHWRRRGPEKQRFANTDPESRAEEADARAVDSELDERRQIARALESLSFDHRTVVVLRFWEDRSLEEIAEATGQPLGTVKSRLHAAKQEIRRLLSKKERK